LSLGPLRELKGKLNEVLTNARSEGFTEPLHVSYNIAIVGGTESVVSALVVPDASSSKLGSDRCPPARRGTSVSESELI
jgi:hypothetical protein